ncbi:MAG: phage/plasmid primase, P4 family [Planctomycetota bacterium]|nr:phage/plasmid primase, P4 family [Planctomycetota bacterium]
MLNKKHRAELRASGISDELIETSGLRSISSREAHEILHWSAGPGSRDMSGLAIPFRANGETVAGYTRIKPDNPRTNRDGKPVKYESPRGKSNRAYFPPGFQEALPTARTVLISEGEKKALSAMSHGFPCIGLVGVWGFQRKRKQTDSGRKYGKRELIADLEAINWKGRQVAIALDSDRTTNDLVLLAEYKLAEALQAAGANVSVVRLPSLNDDKTGLDDFLVAKGAAELQRLIDAAEPTEKPDPPNVMEWARLYLQDRHVTPKGLRLRWWRDEYYESDGRRYAKVSPTELTADVQDWLDTNGANATPRLAGDVTKSLHPLCMVPFENEVPCFLDGCNVDPENVIEFNNGLLDITNVGGDLRTDGHTPTWFSTSVLPYSFDPKVTCPQWLVFLGEVLGDDELIDLLQRWFGLCLVADTSYQKLLMLIGPRRSGKGTICRTLQHVIGPDKCTSPTLTSLGGDFGLWQLIGADVAILADAHLGRRADSTRVLEVIKSIVGEDPQNINRKCLPFLQNVRLATRFIITVNELPHFSDVSGALVSRLLVIPFLKSFADCMDRKLEGKLKSEASGILNWALRGLYRLRQNGFSEPGASRSVLDNYRRITSPVSAFLDDCCTVQVGAAIETGRLFTVWRVWCKSHGHEPGSDARFGERIRAANPAINRQRPRVGDRRVYQYIGLELSADGSELLHRDDARS